MLRVQLVTAGLLANGPRAVFGIQMLEFSNAPPGVVASENARLRRRREEVPYFETESQEQTGQALTLDQILLGPSRNVDASSEEGGGGDAVMVETPPSSENNADANRGEEQDGGLHEGVSSPVEPIAAAGNGHDGHAHGSTSDAEGEWGAHEREVRDQTPADAFAQEYEEHHRLEAERREGEEAGVRDSPTPRSSAVAYDPEWGYDLESARQKRWTTVINFWGPTFVQETGYGEQWRDSFFISKLEKQFLHEPSSAAARSKWEAWQTSKMRWLREHDHPIIKFYGDRLQNQMDAAGERFFVDLDHQIPRVVVKDYYDRQRYVDTQNSVIIRQAHIEFVLLKQATLEDGTIGELPTTTFQETFGKFMIEGVTNLLLEEQKLLMHQLKSQITDVPRAYEVERQIEEIHGQFYDHDLGHLGVESSDDSSDSDEDFHGTGGQIQFIKMVFSRLDEEQEFLSGCEFVPIQFVSTDGKLEYVDNAVQYDQLMRDYRMRKDYYLARMSGDFDTLAGGEDGIFMTGLPDEERAKVLAPEFLALEKSEKLRIEELMRAREEGDGGRYDRNERASSRASDASEDASHPSSEDVASVDSLQREIAAAAVEARERSVAGEDEVQHRSGSDDRQALRDDRSTSERSRSHSPSERSASADDGHPSEGGEGESHSQDEDAVGRTRVAYEVGGPGHPSALRPPGLVSPLHAEVINSGPEHFEISSTPSDHGEHGKVSEVETTSSIDSAEAEKRFRQDNVIASNSGEEQSKLQPDNLHTEFAHMSKDELRKQIAQMELEEADLNLELYLGSGGNIEMFRQTLRDSSYESSEQAVDESEDRMFRHAERQMWQICEGNVEMLRTHFRNTVSRDKYSDQQVDEFVAVVADRCRTWFAEHGDDRPEGPSASQSDVSGNNDDSSVVGKKH